MRLPASCRRVIDGGALAHVVTLDPDGSPQVSCVWAGVDGDDVVFTSIPPKRKLANLRRDPRIAISFHGPARDAEGLEDFLVLHGRATVLEGAGDAALRRIAENHRASSATRAWIEQLPPGANALVRVTVERIGGRGPWVGHPHAG